MVCVWEGVNAIARHPHPGMIFRSVNIGISKVVMYEFWYDYLKKKKIEMRKNVNILE